MIFSCQTQDFGDVYESSKCFRKLLNSDVRNNNKTVIVYVFIFHKIIIENRKAVGVEYVLEEETRTVRVNKEVALCGGVVDSPQVHFLNNC